MRRVRKVNVGCDGIPFYLSGKGERRRVYHPSELDSLFEGTESKEFDRQSPEARRLANTKPLHRGTSLLTAGERRKPCSNSTREIYQCILSPYPPIITIVTCLT